jgi:hypothetical protein
VGSKGSDTKTTAPNPTAMAAYQDILSRAQGVSGTPYTPYTGQLVAPVNTQQNLGISNINQNAGFAFPYIQQAAGYANDAAQPLTHDQIQYYTDPYTQRVIQATQAQFANQNEQQRQGVIGNAISKGALGGNREAIAEAELANQQQLAQAPVIAGLQSQGYTTGLNTALTEQQARAQGAYSLGNLGVSGQNAALTGANAQVGAGTLQQGTQQAQDAALYQQFINQQAYPFQTTQWLAGIGSGIGSQMGSTTTGPSPSLMGQLLGLGAAGIGAAGKAGLFASAGGRVPGFADGGIAEAPPTNGVGAVLGGTPYGSGSGWIPRMDIARGRGAPHASEGVAPPQSLAQQAKEIGSLANIINGGPIRPTSSTTPTGNRPGNYGGSPETNPKLMPYAGEDESEGLYRGGMVRALWRRRQSAVPPYGTTPRRRWLALRHGLFRQHIWGADPADQRRL